MYPRRIHTEITVLGVVSILGTISMIPCRSPGQLGMGSSMPMGWGGGDGGHVPARELRGGAGARHVAQVRGGSREHMGPQSWQRRMDLRLHCSAGPKKDGGRRAGSGSLSATHHPDQGQPRAPSIPKSSTQPLAFTLWDGHGHGGRRPRERA